MNRLREPVEAMYVDEELSVCPHCDTRTHIDAPTYYATGTKYENCPGCGQRFLVIEEEDDFDRTND